MSNELWDDLVARYMVADIQFENLKLITLAQWALESGWGTSKLAQDHLNFAGLKYRNRMQGFAEPVDYDAHDGEDTYCAFKDLDSFVVGYWHFIASGPYSGWEAFADDPAGFITHLASRGYASDPDYVQKVLSVHGRIAESSGLDTELDRPSRRELGESPTQAVYETVAGTEHRYRGRYANNGPDGVIVHYDAFRIKPKGTASENSDWASRRTIEMGAGRFAYMCISRTGSVFLPANWDTRLWGEHAGKSRCPETNRTWVSRFYLGIEMNNPGMLYEAEQDGVFCPWFNSRRDSQDNNVILDSRGRCTRVSAHDEWYSADEVRFASGGNIAAGYYLPYTAAQYEALLSVLLDLIRSHPTINPAYIFGHDEVSPGRKTDPGGALGDANTLVTMAELRRQIAALLAQ